MYIEYFMRLGVILYLMNCSFLVRLFYTNLPSFWWDILEEGK